MKKISIFSCLCVLLIYAQSFAGSLEGGTYALNDGTMTMTLNINAMPDGKFFINGMGNDKNGNSCRIGDLAYVKGNKLIIGVCEMEISVSGNKFVLKDARGCAQCIKGAYVSGTYQKQ